MRPLCALILTWAGCANDPCAGIDGACVSLTVDGSGQIDGLVINVSGAASGTRVLPPMARVAPLPVAVALQLKNATSGTLHIAVEGVYFGAIVGAGTTDVDVAPRVAATVVLDPSFDAGLLFKPDLAVPPDLTFPSDLACPSGAPRCNGVCCDQGATCSGNKCVYQTAQLYFYLCPSFNMGCSATTLLVDNVCHPLAGPAAGTCYATGINVSGGQTYSIAMCSQCPSNCSNQVPFTTPATFATSTYYPGISFYCKTTCTAPGNCP